MITIFENWKDNTIDNALFTSGRAKHNPTVINSDTVEYKTDNGKYLATIKQIGDKFLCKVYRIKGDGSKIRIKKKKKNNLDNAHNFTREFLNDRLEGKKLNKKKKKRKTIPKKEKDPLDKLFVDEIPTDFDSNFNFDYDDKSRKTIIRRFS